MGLMIVRRFRLAALFRSSLLVASMWLVACTHRSDALTNDAYIWQRVWTPAVAQAMHDGAADVRQWRVLAAQTDRAGRLQVFHPDITALSSSGKPVVLVVRIDGQLIQWNEALLLADTVALWTSWQGHGIRLAGLEIDHDGGTARLPAYAHYLAALRSSLPGVRLSITALPAWLHSPDLAAVLAQVDESVLQVHAVRNPRAGLFDGALAMRWVDDYAQRGDKPFRVALPTYGSRVSWDAQGHLVSVQSEAGVLDAGDDSRELLATPQEVAAFLARLQHDPPAHLAGIVWFRLPIASDDRAWSLPTWLAVMRQQPLHGEVTASARLGSTAGTLDLVLENPGELDQPLPAAAVLPKGCTLADGINGYALSAGRDTLRIERRQPGLLRAHGQRVIGWARCATEGVQPHVEP
jgi:hypothetical protein